MNGKVRYAWAGLFCFIISAVLMIILLTALFSEAATAAKFSWLPNSESDLAGYTIHYGENSREYTVDHDCGLPESTDTEAGTRVLCAIDNLLIDTDGELFFAVTAYDQSGVHSDYSNEVSYDNPPAPVQDFQNISVVIININQ